jgi:hypothetical protein
MCWSHPSATWRDGAAFSRGTSFDDRPGGCCAGEKTMLWTIFVVLMVLWLAGVTTSYTLGGFIHILLLLAVASVLIRIIQGRSVV